MAVFGDGSADAIEPDPEVGPGVDAPASEFEERIDTLEAVGVVGRVCAISGLVLLDSVSLSSSLRAGDGDIRGVGGSDAETIDVSVIMELEREEENVFFFRFLGL